jgi:hypothetical protein
MTKAKGKGLSLTSKIIIASVVVVGAGVGLYFLLRKKSRSEESKEKGTTDAGAGSKQEKKVDVPTQCKAGTPPAELKTRIAVSEFQKWLDSKHEHWYKNNKTGKYTNVCVKSSDGRLLDDGKYCGDYGCGTEKAWGIWGKSYTSEKQTVGAFYKSPLGTTKTDENFVYGSLYTPKVDTPKVDLSSLYYKPYNSPFAYNYFEGDKYEPTSSFTPEQLDLNL